MYTIVLQENKKNELPVYSLDLAAGTPAMWGSSRTVYFVSWTWICDETLGISSSI